MQQYAAHRVGLSLQESTQAVCVPITRVVAGFDLERHDPTTVFKDEIDLGSGLGPPEVEPGSNDAFVA